MSCKSRAASGSTTASGRKFLHAGPGYVGSCFRKDTVALIKTGQDYEAPQRIVETVVAVNEALKRGMFRKIAAALGGSLRGKTTAVLDLTFKPNTTTCATRPLSR
jgi:UDPglucose 6-dehydrogenase